MSPPPSERDGLDPFWALGLEARFDIDPDAVRAAYRARAADSHPDRAADPAVRASLARASAGLAEAQRILLDPIRRAEAIIASLGGTVAASPPSGEFLVEMMELREAIDAAGGDPATLGRIAMDIDGRIGQARDRLATILAEIAERERAGRVGGLRIAADLLGVLRYLDRLRAAIDEASLPPEGTGD